MACPNATVCHPPFVICDFGRTHERTRITIHHQQCTNKMKFNFPVCSTNISPSAIPYVLYFHFVRFSSRLSFVVGGGGWWCVCLCYLRSVVHEKTITEEAVISVAMFALPLAQSNRCGSNSLARSKHLTRCTKRVQTAADMRWLTSANTRHSDCLSSSPSARLQSPHHQTHTYKWTIC